MGLKEQIVIDLTAAMKTRAKIKTDALRMLKAEIMKYEVSAANMIATDEVIIGLVNRGIKQRNEASEAFAKGGRQEMADKEKAEAEILKTYLPRQLDETELQTVIKRIIGELKAKPSDIGKVIGAVMTEVRGKADGKLVSESVKKALQ